MRMKLIIHTTSDFSMFQNYKLPSDYLIIGFHVVALFNNISYDIVSSARKENWDNVSKNFQFNQVNFLSIINFLFNNSYYTYIDAVGTYNQMNSFNS